MEREAKNILQMSGAYVIKDFRNDMVPSLVRARTRSSGAEGEQRGVRSVVIVRATAQIKVDAAFRLSKRADHAISDRQTT